MTSSREFLDGPRLVEWLATEGITSGGESRSFKHWKEGNVATVYSVDRFLTKRGLHIHLLPDDVWVEKPERGVR